MIKKILILSFNILFFNSNVDSAYAESTAESVRKVGVYQLKKAVNGTVEMYLIDVRPEAKYKESHIKTAINLPLKSLGKNVMEGLVADKNARIVFYGEGEDSDDSLIAATKTIGYGYNKVYRYEGGFGDWEERQFPRVTGMY